MPYQTTEERLAYASARITQLEQLLEDYAGVQSVTVNGTATTYTNLLEQRQYWLNEYSRLEGATATVRTIRLGGGA